MRNVLYLDVLWTAAPTTDGTQVLLLLLQGTLQVLGLVPVVLLYNLEHVGEDRPPDPRVSSRWPQGCCRRVLTWPGLTGQVRPARQMIICLMCSVDQLII